MSNRAKNREWNVFLGQNPLTATGYRVTAKSYGGAVRKAVRAHHASTPECRVGRREIKRVKKFQPHSDIETGGWSNVHGGMPL